MKNVLLQQAIKLNKNRKARKGWQTVVRTLAAGVVFCTTYVLILPAITMQQEPACGFEEHTHTAACYAAHQAQLSGCGISEDAVVVHQHNDLCRNDAGNLICTLQERSVHAHDDGCYTAEPVLSCTVTHVHSEACEKTETTKVCTLEESEDHTHGEGCFAVTEIPCLEPTAQDHVHTDACWQQTRKLTCGTEELQLHSHEEACRDADGNLTCTRPAVVEHIHTEACLETDEGAQGVLVCGLQEHIHIADCYPMEENTAAEKEYHCGLAPHRHDAPCYELDGTLKCTIPVHTHDTLCLINDLDLTADVETAEAWEATLEEVELTGVWADDLLAVAESQLGYRESRRNCILFEEELLGYTRYGAWYGNEYGKWDDMFLSFCLHYAEIDEEAMPRESDTARWIQALTEKNLYQDTRTAEPVPGDLIFFDTDEDDKADFAGVVAELLPEEELRILAGDTKNDCVASETVKRADETILGFGKLPENPGSEKPDVSAMLAALPDAEALEQILNTYQSKGDRTGFENELKNLAARLETIRAAYDALSPEEKALVTGTEKLDALLEACGTIGWKEIPALTADAAMISALTETAAEIQSAAEAEAGILRNQDSVTWQFTAETKAHDAESLFSAARVKVELVLPMTADKAVFDTEAMTWLEEAKLTTETRTIGEARVNCQVLTGVKQLLPAEGAAAVIPGSFTETVKVNLLNAAHNDQVCVLISAAMEQGDWDGVCWLHQVEEKQTLQTTAFAVSNPMDPDDQQANYDAFKASIEALIDQNFPLEQSVEVADQVQDDLDAAYVSGMLSYELYYDLSMMVIQNLGDPTAIAEAAIGNFWKHEVPSPRTHFTPKAEPNIPVIQKQEAPAAYGLLRSRNVPTSSNAQIVTPGGANDKDGEIHVSKTIEGTELENVFDITLQIVTQDRIETVYEEPNMAVVIVTDISHTMNNVFTGETSSRYQAAMKSAEDFINRFQQEAGPVSRIGYVAFNTHAHQIFDLQTCETPQKAQALAKEMNDETAAIVSATGYSSSHDRFTNIEAGLKMAKDMLDKVSNPNKFIVFLSDGFPTTYVSSGYNGYDPYTTSGSNGTDGVFYDAVMGVHCDYGTSYSDTAAIKARKMASSIKASGIDIFSIGVDVAGQTIKYYHDDSANRLKTASTVERRKKSYEDDVYEIGHWSTTAAFENWLKGGESSGIGSGDGYYFSSKDTSGLHAAYDEIFEKIKILNGASSHLDWVVTDPMPGMGVQKFEDIEFIAFWDLGENAFHDSITANLRDGLYDENTVSFDKASKTISWDLKKSYYGAIAGESGNQYQFRLKYRIRLQNEEDGEEDGFVENTPYNTNDVTRMGYRLIKVTNGVTVIGDREYIDFPIPAVKGYLSELNFLKVDSLNNPIPGAEFTLTHNTDPEDPDACPACRGDGQNYVAVGPFVETSELDGAVTFTNLPSGHSYVLTETKIPEGYLGNTNTYKVKIAYDNLSVTVKDENDNVLEWNETVENGLFYELPRTGSTGTSHFTFGGFALIIAAALMYICIPRAKRKKGGR